MNPPSPSLIRFWFVPRNDIARLLYKYEETTRCFRSSLVPQIQVMRAHYPRTIKRAGVNCFCGGVLYHARFLKHPLQIQTVSFILAFLLCSFLSFVSLVTFAIGSFPILFPPSYLCVRRVKIFYFLHAMHQDQMLL